MPHGWHKPQQQSDPDPGDVSVCVEIDPLHEHRMRCLQEAGFTEFLAFRISVAAIDWHDAARLLANGCDEQTVYDILA